MISLKYTGKNFGVMNEDEIWFAAKTILLKIHTITGWSIPVSELMDILIDQFTKKLQEGYAKVTIAEIEYAFRNRSIDLKDWGKALNLTLIDEVMLPYLENRMELSKMEESIKTKSLMIDEKKDLSDDEWDGWIKDMRSYDFKILPCSAYDYLTKKGEINISNEKKHEYMDKAIGYLLANIEQGTNEFYSFNSMRKDGVFNVEITATLITISKRFAIYDYLQSTK